MYERERKAVLPPDGGWGWVVVVAAFMVCAIVDGIAMNAATIYVNFPSFIRAMNAEHAKLPPIRCYEAATGDSTLCPAFESNNSSTGIYQLPPPDSVDDSGNSFEPMANFFIGATLISIYMLIGPFSAALINVYGSRRIIIIGSIIAAVGFSLSALLIEHERVLLLTHGVAGGIGLGLMNVGAIVAVGLYFNTRRSLAIGLALCGSGAGMTIAPLVIEPILTEHGLYYAYVILACFSLQGVVAGVLVRPIKPINPDRKIQYRRKDVVDRVLEWSKNVKHIRSDSLNSIDKPEHLDRLKQEVLKSRLQRIRRLEIDSVPSSLIGSRLSVGAQPIQNFTPASHAEVLYSPNARFDPIFCQVFGSELLSPVPTASAGNSAQQSANTPSPLDGVFGNTLSTPSESTATRSYNIPPPIFFLTLPIPAAGISSQHPVWSPGMAPDELYRFTRPSACVCSVLLDGGMLVASKIISSQQVAKSCPDLSFRQEGSSLRRRRFFHRPQPPRPQQQEISVTPQTTKERSRRRRQRSSGRYAPVESTVAEGVEEPSTSSTAATMLSEDDEMLPKVTISNIPPQPRRMIRRRTGAVTEERSPSPPLVPPLDPLMESALSSAEPGVQRDSGISNSSNNSDTSERASQKLLDLDEKGGDVASSPKTVLFAESAVGDQDNLLDNANGYSDIDQEDNFVGEGQTDSTRSYIERRRRRRQLTRDMSSRDVRGNLSAVGLEPDSPNVFRHLLSVLEAILDISLLKDLRFWIILFGNLLLMVTFLLLPLNADVVKTIRALDGLQAEHSIRLAALTSAQQSPATVGNNADVLDGENLAVESLASSGDSEANYGNTEPLMWTPEDDYFGPNELYEPMPHMYAILLSVCGCTQTIVRAIAGFFADYPRVDATIMVTVAMAVGSVAFLLLGLEEVLKLGLAVFFALLVVVSACSGVFFALATTVIVDTFGVERLTSCFGMITMIRGLAPYVTIGFMLSVSSLIDGADVNSSGASGELLPFRIACILCAALVFICSLLHALLYWLRKRQVANARSGLENYNGDTPIVALQSLESS